MGAKILQNRGLGDKYSDGAGDEKRGDQTGENMLPGIFLKHHECLKPRLANDGVIPGKIVNGQKNKNNNQ